MSPRRTPLCLLLLWLCCAAPARAISFDPGPQPAYAAALLMEAQTGAVLYSYEPHLQRSPASTMKLLLELVVMDRVEAGKCRLEDEVLVSARASRIGGSQVYLKEGEVFTVADLMQAVIIPSANDACMALAEHIAGSAEGFVDMLNARAQSLGLEHTRCVNVHGLDDTPIDNGNVTTAYDLARIARVLVAHPQILEWSAIRQKPFRDGRFTLQTTNRLLGKYEGLDGLKTGYTGRAGFCLVATAQRDSMRLIAVVLGTPSERAREREIARLLTWGFNNFTRVPLARAGQPLGTVAVNWGHEPEVRAIIQDSAYAVLSPEQEKLLARRLDLPAERKAPVLAGEPLGRLEVSLGDSLIASLDVVAETAVGRMTLWEKVSSWF